MSRPRPLLRIRLPRARLELTVGETTAFCGVILASIGAILLWFAPTPGPGEITSGMIRVRELWEWAGGLAIASGSLVVIAAVLLQILGRGE